MNKDDWKEELDDKRKEKLSEFFDNDRRTSSNDAKRLSKANWEELAFYVWYDTMYGSKEGGHKHAQKWTGMLTARLLSKLDEGGKRIERLTKWMIGFVVFQIIVGVIQIVQNCR